MNELYCSAQVNFLYAIIAVMAVIIFILVMVNRLQSAEKRALIDQFTQHLQGTTKGDIGDFL